MRSIAPFALSFRSVLVAIVSRKCQNLVVCRSRYFSCNQQPEKQRILLAKPHMPESWRSRLGALAKYLGVTADIRPASDEVLQAIKREHLELLQRRLTFAVWFGVFAYLVDLIELWADFHDYRTIAMQLSAELSLIGLAALTCTAWGKHRKFGLFHAGYALVLVAYEVTVCYERAFGTVWGEGFTESFMFYCLLIPVSVPLTATVGIASMLLMSIPEAVITGRLISGTISFVGNITAFCILLGSRLVANSAWENEKSAQHAEAAVRKIQAETMKLQLDFISAVSHELRNPSAALLLTTEHLLSAKVAEPDMRAKHDLLFRESKRLSKRVEGLLAFGRMLSPGMIEYRRDFLDPVELVEDVVREFHSANSGPRSELLLSAEDDTPLIEGDATALSTVLWNLLENAVKYSPDCNTVWIELGSEGHSAYIRVRDRGRGIAEGEIPRVFEKYFRGESAHHTTGTGIGLAMVRFIVEAHRGTIRLESGVGQGSSFTLVLPSAESNQHYEGIP